MTKTGFVTARREFVTGTKPGPNSPVVVELRTAGSVTGRVVFADGRPAGAEITVCTRTAEPTSRRIRMFKEGYPVLECASTDAKGRFKVEGLDPYRAYTFVAGGRGLAMHPFTQRTKTTPALQTEDLVIVVGRTYGALVVLTHEDGSPLRINKELRGGQGVRPISPAPSHWVIAGSTPFSIARVLDGTRLSPNDFVVPLVYTHSTGETPLGQRITLSIDLPFYHPTEVDVPLGVLNSDSDLFQVRLKPVAEPFAEVIFDLKWPAQIGGATTRPPKEEYVLPRSIKDACGAVVVNDTAGRTLALSPVELGAPFILEQLPQGTYRARFVSEVGWCEQPDRRSAGIEFRVGEKRARVPIDLTSYGGVELTILDSYEIGPGSAQLRLQYDHEDAELYANPLASRLFAGGRLRFSTRHSRTLFPMSSGRYRANIRISTIRDGRLSRHRLPEVVLTVGSDLVPVEIPWIP